MPPDATARLIAYLEAEAIDPSALSGLFRLWTPIADEVAASLAPGAPPFIVGVCGAQGSGKSTGAGILALLLRRRGLKVAALSMDDLYLPRAERARLAREVHPLLAVRGPPGTHDVKLGLAVLDALGGAGPVAIPRFDKAADDRRPEAEWDVFEGPADVVVLEGWCLGAAPQAAADLEPPNNALEREQDPHGVWRAFVNAALEGDYRRLFARIDRLILLEAPRFSVVSAWRAEQEAKLRARTPPGEAVRIMTPAEIDTFVQHYERVTRHILAEMPSRADVVVELGPDRRVLKVRRRTGAGAPEASS